MSPVGLVCDSTCDVDPAWLKAKDVRMVPLTVFFGEEGFRDRVEMQPDEFYERLAAFSGLPTTSQPSPADFAAAYRELAASGCDSIVSVHLTSKLSGTFESATLAAAEAPVPVAVIDTKLVSSATALAVKAAVVSRDAGGTHDDVVTAATRVADSCRLFFVLDTLDYLVKGGRAGKAQGLAASLLNIKPILTFNDEGTIEPFKKAKGRKKALVELAQYVAEESRRLGKVRLALLHARDEDLARELQGALADAGADFELDSVNLIGAVIGTYAGPHAVGAAYYPIG